MKKLGILTVLFFLCARASSKCLAQSVLEIQQTVSTNIVGLETNLIWTVLLTNSGATTLTNTSVEITYDPGLQAVALVSDHSSFGVWGGWYVKSFHQPPSGTATAEEGPSGLVMPPSSSETLVYSVRFKTNQLFNLSSRAVGYFDDETVTNNATTSVYAIRLAPKLDWVNAVTYDFFAGYKTNRLADPELSWEYYEGDTVFLKQASTLNGPWSLFTGSCTTNHPFTNVVSITATVSTSGMGFYRVEKP